MDAIIAYIGLVVGTHAGLFVGTLRAAYAGLNSIA